MDGRMAGWDDSLVVGGGKEACAVCRRSEKVLGYKLQGGEVFLFCGSDLEAERGRRGEERVYGGRACVRGCRAVVETSRRHGQLTGPLVLWSGIPLKTHGRWGGSCNAYAAGADLAVHNTPSSPDYLLIGLWPPATRLLHELEFRQDYPRRKQRDAPTGGRRHKSIEQA